MSIKKYTGQLVFHIIMLVVFAALFLVGTFYDETIAAAIYTPDNLPAIFITTAGIYPFFASAVLFMGTLTERTIHSGLNKPLKVLFCCICACLALYSGFEGSRSLLSVDCLGGVFPMLNHNTPIAIVVSIVAAYPLFFLGYRLGAKSKDKLLAKKILGLVAIMLIALLSMEVLKIIFSRPRYRIVVRGYEGIGFVPWYEPFSGAAGFIGSFGLEKTDLRSFPSGHSVLSISCVYILLSVVWLFPKLKKRVDLLLICGLTFGIIVMFTRMQLGAHYLSDVSAGALIGTALSLIYVIIQHRIFMSRHPGLSREKEY